MTAMMITLKLTRLMKISTLSPRTHWTGKWEVQNRDLEGRLMCQMRNGERRPSPLSPLAHLNSPGRRCTYRCLLHLSPNVTFHSLPTMNCDVGAHGAGNMVLLPPSYHVTFFQVSLHWVSSHLVLENVFRIILLVSVNGKILNHGKSYTILN